MLKNIILFLLVLVVTSCVSPTKLTKTPVIITNGDHLYEVLLNSLHIQQDSLPLWNSDGVVFFRMQFSNNHFINIQASKDYPPILVRIVKRVIAEQEIQLNTKAAKNYYFVLPVRYYLGSNKPGTLRPLLDAMPKIDITKLNGSPVNWFNQFFDMENAEGEMKGVPCILLTWLSVRGKVQ